MCFALVFSKGTPQILMQLVHHRFSNSSKLFLTTLTKSIGQLGSENSCLLGNAIF